MTLLKAVLSNLPTYYLSTFTAPISFYKEVEKAIRNSIWEGAEKNGDPHLVRWDIVTLPKDLGGLGVEKIITSNVALLSNGYGDILLKKIVFGGF